jgi:hypothetical protein
MNSVHAEPDFAGRDGMVRTNVSSLRNSIICPCRELQSLIDRSSSLSASLRNELRALFERIHLELINSCQTVSHSTRDAGL